MKRSALAALVSVLGLAVFFPISACGASSPPAPTPAIAAPVLEAVVFQFGTDLFDLTEAGRTAQITALGVLSNGRTADVTTTCTAWSSDDLSVLTVTSGGMLTAQASRGSARIATACQGIGASGLVTLNPPPSPILSGPPADRPGQPTGGGTLCLNPPYHFNELAQRCQEDKGGQFAKNECCGRPAARGVGR